MLAILLLLQEKEVVKADLLVLVNGRQNDSETIEEGLERVRIIYLCLYTMGHEQNGHNFGDIRVQIRAIFLFAFQVIEVHFVLALLLLVFFEGGEREAHYFFFFNDLRCPGILASLFANFLLLCFHI